MKKAETSPLQGSIYKKQIKETVAVGSGKGDKAFPTDKELLTPI